MRLRDVSPELLGRLLGRPIEECREAFRLVGQDDDNEVWFSGSFDVSVCWGNKSCTIGQSYAILGRIKEFLLDVPISELSKEAAERPLSAGLAIFPGDTIVGRACASVYLRCTDKLLSVFRRFSTSSEKILIFLHRRLGHMQALESLCHLYLWASDFPGWQRRRAENEMFVALCRFLGRGKGRQMHWWDDMEPLAYQISQGWGDRTRLYGELKLRPWKREDLAVRVLQRAFLNWTYKIGGPGYRRVRNHYATLPRRAN